MSARSVPRPERGDALRSRHRSGNNRDCRLAAPSNDLITASRAYEANLSVVKNARQMAMKVLEIGK